MSLVDVIADCSYLRCVRDASAVSAQYVVPRVAPFGQPEIDVAMPSRFIGFEKYRCFQPMIGADTKTMLRFVSAADHLILTGCDHANIAKGYHAG